MSQATVASIKRRRHALLMVVAARAYPIGISTALANWTARESPSTALDMLAIGQVPGWHKAWELLHRAAPLGAPAPAPRRSPQEALTALARRLPLEVPGARTWTPGRPSGARCGRAAWPPPARPPPARPCGQRSMEAPVSMGAEGRQAGGSGGRSHHLWMQSLPAVPWMWYPHRRALQSYLRGSTSSSAAVRASLVGSVPSAPSTSNKRYTYDSCSTRRVRCRARRASARYRYAAVRDAGGPPSLSARRAAGLH